MRPILRILLSAASSLLVVAIPMPAPAAAADEPQIATGEVAGTILTVSPRMPFESATLRVAGPSGYEAIAWSEGEPLSLDLVVDGFVSADGVAPSSLAALPDGRYGYEVVFYLPGGDQRAHDGRFFVEDGGVIESRPGVDGPRSAPSGGLVAEERQGPENVNAAATPADDSLQVLDTNDDDYTYVALQNTNWDGGPTDDHSIVNDEGDLLFGGMSEAGPVAPYRFSIMNNGNVGIGTTLPQADLHIFRPGGNIRITDSDACPNANAAWEIEEDFGRLKFEVVPNCPGDLDGGKMWIHGNGNVGIGAADPGEELEILAEFPSVRLHDNVGTTQVWDIEGNSFDFQVQDVTNGKIAPFLIEPGTPHHTLHLDSTGRVGIGTPSPGEELEIVGAAPGIRLRDNVSPTAVWDVKATNSAFAVHDVGSGGGVPFRIAAGAPSTTLTLSSTGAVGVGTVVPAAKLHVLGNGIIEGDVALGSSRTIKHEIEPLDGAEILSAIRELPVYAWKYKDDPVQASHVGPMAEDVHAAFRLGRDEKHLSPSDSAGLALAGLKGIDERLDRELDELRVRNTELAAANEVFQERLAAMEERLSDALAAMQPPAVE